MSQGTYICQRAAEAIIADIGPFRLSNDALQTINLFLDEFLAVLLLTATQLDLVRIKAAVIQLLPHYSLGKNALVEAELELKQQLESSKSINNLQQPPQHDFSTYEKMRSLTIGTGPDCAILEPNIVISLLQQACSSHSALSGASRTLKDIYSSDGAIIIAPVVMVYVTAIVEHIAEYLLNAVAMMADRVNADYIKVKEVLYTLIEDPQVGNLFRRMNLKETLEKKLVLYPNSYMNSLPSPAPSPVAGKKDQFLQRRNTATSSRDFQFSFNEDTTNMYEQHLDDSSMRSTESISDRSLSIISSSTTRSSNSSSTTKSRFNIFSGSINNGAHDKKKPKEKRTTSLSLGFASTGNKRNSSSSSKTKKSKNGSARPSFSSDTLSPTTPPPLPTASAFSAINISDFDDLLKSGGTKKVSLTPNRLKSIEVRDAATVSTIVDSCSTSEEEEEEIISKGREDIKVNSRSDNIARSSSSSSSTITATKKKRSVEYLNTRTSNSPSPSSLPQPPLPPLPRLSREQMSNLHSQYLANSNSNSNQSPPLTPASSLAFRQSSQRSVYSATHQNQACDDNKQQQQQHRHQLSSSYASSIYSSSSSMASSLKSSTTHEEISQRGVPQEFSSLPTLGSHHPHPILRRTSERIPTHSNTLNNTFGGNTSAANNNNRRNVVISQSNTVIGLNLQSAYSSSDSTSTIQPAKPLHCFQRPSSNVLKRASMGSRPPSFHESMFDRSTSAMLLNMSATNCNLHGLLKEGLGNDTEVEQVNSIAKDMRNSVAATLVDEDEDESKQHDMVYVLPAHSSMSYNTLSFSTKQQSLLRQPSLLAAQQEQQQQKFKIPRKSVSTSPFLVNASVSSTITNSNSRGIDQACQTDPLSDFLNTDTYSNEEDEEWFFDEEHEDSVAESERLAVEWLLGCA